MIDKIVGHYRIVEKLGEGGMGVVFKARDTHLDRFAALKLLRPDKMSDPDRQRRFVQEAKAASALNHPNIVHIYDISEDGGAPFIAMEFVSGKTLDELIRRKGLPVNEVLKCAVQIADALARAHAAGIVHRDLKPSNIMLAADGLVKILDFGLAKLTEPPGTDEFAPTAVLSDRPHTEDGMIVGTISYMSPEQAQGKKVDTRSDIFSLGAVLYEALSGRRAFQGETRMSTITAIARDEPAPIRDIVPGMPPELDRILSRCLRKDPERRFQTAADLKVALLEVKEESESGKLAAPGLAAPARRVVSPAFVAVAAILLLVGVAAAWFLRAKSPKQEALTVMTRLTSDSGLTTDGTISQDGKLVAYASDRASEDNLDIWLQQVAGGAPIRLTSHQADDHQPDFSPDGSRIAFRSEREGGGVYIISTLGGEDRLIAKNGERPRFSPDGNWIAYDIGGAGLRSSSIYIVSSAGGPPRELKLSIPWAGQPVWSPDGKRLIFRGSTNPSGFGSLDWWVASSEGGRAIQTGAAADFARHRLTFRFTVPFPQVWSGDQIVFSATLGDASNLWRIAIKPGTWQILEPPQRRIQVTDGTGIEAAPWWSPDGNILYFLSQRDGFQCIWAQHLDRATKRPAGVPFAVAHFHGARHRVQEAGFGPAIGIDRLVFTLSDSTGNIWMAQPGAQN